MAVRVAMYYNNRDVRLEEMPKPEVGSGELLVRSEACGICGSDVMEWYRVPRAPLVLGHEMTGQVVEVGEGVEKFAVGDRVFVSHHVPCNICRYCLGGHHTVCETLRRTNYDPGGMAEFVRIPKTNIDSGGVFKLPHEVSYEEGTFIEPLGCVYRGQRLAHMEAGKSILVLGSGITGLLHIKLARALGAGRIIATDVVDYRLKTAEKFGAEHVIDARKDVPALVKEANEGRLADIVIVSTGSSSAINQALHSVDWGGTILFFAPTDPGKDIEMPFNQLWRNEVTMVSSYGASPRDLSVSIELIRSRQVKVVDMITHRLKLEEAAKGFQLVASAGESIKVIIEPQK